MKKSFIFICIVGLIAIYSSCKKTEVNKPDLGVPENVITVPPDTTLINTVDTLLTNNGSTRDSYPTLFKDTVEHRIIVTKETEVLVTFLYEGAGWENSLGYYTYNKEDTLTMDSVKRIQKIVFKNISGIGGGGGLESGNMVSLGTFKAGTVIGLYLVAQGWDSDTKQIRAGLYTHYTDRIYNNYANETDSIVKSQQSVLFVEKESGKLIVGFEDTAMQSGGDYNDVVVSVTDNRDINKAPTSFNLSKVPRI